jgi:O-antigen/teichoic acid export membrane protein
MLKSILGNSLFSLISDVADRFSLALLLVLVVRVLGEEIGGVLSLSTNYVLLFSSIAFWGLDQLLIRDVARDPSSATRYFVHFLLIRLAVTPLLWFLLAALIMGLHPYRPLTNQFIAVVGGMLIGDSISGLGRSLFIVLHRAWLSAILSTGMGIVKLAGGALVLAEGYDPAWLALILVAISWAQAGAMVWLAFRQIDVATFRFRGHFCGQQIKASLPFIPIGVFTAVEAQFGSVMLSFFWSEAAVGAYASANVVLSALALTSQAIRMGLFPEMARFYPDELGRLEDLVSRSWRYLAMIAQPMVVLLILMAPQILFLIYRRENPQSIATLRWLAPTLWFYYLNIPNARLIILHNRQNLMARFYGTSAAANLLAGFLLIPRSGPQGVAIARVVSMAVLFSLNAVHVYGHLLSLRWWRLVWKPIVAALAMVLVFLALPQGWPVWVRAIAGVPAYLAVLAILGAVLDDEWQWLGQRMGWRIGG